LLLREQYLGSLKEPLNKTRKIYGSSTTSLQIRSRPDTKTTERRKSKVEKQRSSGPEVQ
jgi:hypothetical protein